MRQRAVIQGDDLDLEKAKADPGGPDFNTSVNSFVWLSNVRYVLKHCNAAIISLVSKNIQKKLWYWKTT